MLLKHINNTDVAIELLELTEDGDDYIMHVMWWNTGRTVPPWCMWLTQRIAIKKEDMINWEPFELTISEGDRQ